MRQTRTEEEERHRKAEYMRKWRKDNEHFKEYQRKYREKNKARIAAQRAEHRRKNAKQIEERERARREADPFLFVCRKKAVKANKYYSDGPRLTADDIKAVVERCGWKCHWCGKKIEEPSDLTLEHLKPTNDLENLTIACLSCNSAKIHQGGERLSDDERKEKLKRQNREWRERNRDKVRAKEAARNARRRGEGPPVTKHIAAIQWVKDWKPYFQSSPAASLGVKRQAFLKRYPGDITVWDLRYVLDRDGRKCRLCGAEDLRSPNLCLFHTEPVNSIKTIVTACRSCVGKRGGAN